MRESRGSLTNNCNSVPHNLPLTVQHTTFELSAPIDLVSLYIYMYMRWLLVDSLLIKVEGAVGCTWRAILQSATFN
jgi:hypothetical protein